MAIYFYKEFGDLGYLASYSNHGFYKNGIFYKTVEHYYQSEKMVDSVKKTAIIDSGTPKEASLIGRNHANLKKDNWKNIKNKIMYDATLLKFEQNKDIKQKLIETRNQTIYEETVDEYYWGCGKDHSGKNTYGKILMKVRNKIKKDIINSIIKNSINKEIYVIGHKHPDADSIFSSVVLTNILKFYNINAHFAILSEDYDYSEEDKKIISKFLKEEPKIIQDLDDKCYILVDHNDPEQSIGIKYEHNVIGVFDHHIYTGKVTDTLEMEYTSTGLLIYDIFRKRYNFNNEEKLYIGLTTITDSEYLSSSRFSLDDKKLFNSLKLNIDIDKLREEYFVTVNFNQNIDNYLYGSYKKYEKDNKIINKVSFKAYSKDSKNLIVIKEKLLDNNAIWLIIWNEYDTKTTYAYLLRDGLESSLRFDYILTSANLIIKEFEKAGKL